MNVRPALPPARGGPAPPVPAGPRRILVANLGGTGDMILSVPFLRGLRAAHPGAAVTLLTVRRAFDILADSALVDETVELSAITADLRRPGRAWLRLLRPLLALRRRRFDLLINLRPIYSRHAALKAALLVALLGARRSAGRDTEGWGFLYDVKAQERKDDGRHELDHHRALAEALGFPGGDDRTVPLAPRRAAAADRFLREHGVAPDETLVFFNNESRLALKNWPEARALEFLAALLARHPVRALVNALGNPAFGAACARRFGDRALPVESPEIRDVTALVARCRAVVTNDTGIAHLGAATGVPTVVLYGPYDPTLVAPGLPDGKLAVLYKAVHCAPCNRITCDRIECMAAIGAGEVLAAVERFL